MREPTAEERAAEYAKSLSDQTVHIAISYHSFMAGVSFQREIETCLRCENEKMLELLADLDVVLKTAMHNGHHDLIQRVSDVVKGCK